MARPALVTSSRPTSEFPSSAAAANSARPFASSARAPPRHDADGASDEEEIAGAEVEEFQYRGVTFYPRTGRWESHIWFVCPLASFILVLKFGVLLVLIILFSPFHFKNCGKHQTSVFGYDALLLRTPLI
ncbi:AP2-like ethylene-responsive transcription factor TOE2 [Platanthera zijinensis]|uniref:AP2-like ethylene-responsive transcription factor TOE2 n=1 Tax=Platanthera zijinensis TaxID=2320716 RepID=A0AAP0G6H0_9ASPA